MRDHTTEEQENTGNHKSAEPGAVRDLIQLRLPAKPKYLPVLRAAIGVIAGTMEFTYDEIVNLRVAMLEAFDLAAKDLNSQGQVGRLKDLKVDILIEPERLEIQFPIAPSRAGGPPTEEEKESQALLSSLMDELEFEVVAGSGPVMRMVKYNNARERQHGNKGRQQER